VRDEALLGAPAAIQNKVEKKFSKGMREVSVEYSKPVPQSELDRLNLDIICQDPRLSMPGPGRRMLVIKKSKIEENGRQVMEIEPADFHFLLDVAASTYDIEHTETGKGSATRKLQWTIVESEGFKLGRSAIEARI
jgi:hypothetical protein